MNPEANIDGALSELQLLYEKAWVLLPVLGISLLLLIIAFLLARFALWAVERLLRRHIQTKLLRRLVAQLVAVVLFLVGCYVALRIANLTQLAATILGGTGLAGLVFGFAFRDIAENFLASVILSVQRPFQVGDVVSIEGQTGIIERMTIRCTVLMNFEGDHIQIPNSTVFKSPIRNLTANPNQRADFSVGIGYDAAVREAQRLALETISSHPKVLEDPEPWILVDNLGAATINLKLYFWVDISKNNMLKVKSSLMRQVVATFLEHGISMPDEAREIVVPQGITVRTVEDKSPAEEAPSQLSSSTAKAEDKETHSHGEGSFESDVPDIERQLSQSREATEGSNLL